MPVKTPFKLPSQRPISRRSLLAGSVASAGAISFALPAAAAPSDARPRGLDAAQFGVRPSGDVEQTRQLQRALNEAARMQQPLWLGPGLYRSGTLNLSAGAQIIGVRGATRLVLSNGNTLFAARGGSDIALTGLVLDGARRAEALVDFGSVANLRIRDCAFTQVGGNGLSLTLCSGEISSNTVSDCGDNGVMSLDSRLVIRDNHIAKSGNGGIRVWQSNKRHDGSIVEGNTIEDTAARGGGDGQNGNAINVYRAAGVIVRGNVIRRAAFTAIRGNAASQIQIVGNNCAQLGEVAIYSEFDFENAVITDNSIDTAAVGISVTNFNNGGRLATVRGNVIRNLVNKRPQGGPDSFGVGIGVEADTAVSGNVIENAPVMGIEVGTGQYLRDCNVTGNIVRTTGIGIGVSVARGAGHAVIASNVISGARRGAVIGMEWDKAATGDLTRSGADKFPQLTISGNQVS